MFIFTFQTREEMEEQEITIRDLELALQAKINPLKLAETRLENRKMRPHMDLCADVPMEGLIAEVQAIRDTMQMLRDKLDHARYLVSIIQRDFSIIVMSISKELFWMLVIPEIEDPL